MPDLDALGFGSTDHERLYDVVERNGAVTPRDVWEQLSMDPVQFHHQLAVLKRDGRVEKRDGKLRVVREAGAEEECRTDGLTFEIRPGR